jgi:hypothetical protein
MRFHHFYYELHFLGKHYKIFQYCKVKGTFLGPIEKKNDESAYFYFKLKQKDPLIDRYNITERKQNSRKTVATSNVELHRSE